jgi:N-formylglutamate amidohydrolase
LQIEINRSLYMNEATLEKSAGFQQIRAILAELSANLLPYLEQRFAPRQLAAE